MKIEKKYRWLVTGAAGFIGSHLVEALIQEDQEVVGVDNFLTGHRNNLKDIERILPEKYQENFTFHEGDITDPNLCLKLTSEIDFVLHQAALGSVPRSIETPLDTNSNNVTGFINILNACVKNKVKHLVYASSSSVYGDEENLPKVEDKVGSPLSPYAASKKINEIYAEVFYKAYGFNSSGLRYFNVFGPRQDPNGPYAAVIPRWIQSINNNEEITIFGDGENSRDFCFIKNVVQANLKAALFSPKNHNVYNIAFGQQTSLNQLCKKISTILGKDINPIHAEPRKGDIKHSLANTGKAQTDFGYAPEYDIEIGLVETVNWFKDQK